MKYGKQATLMYEEQALQLQLITLSTISWVNPTYTIVQLQRNYSSQLFIEII